MKNNLINNEDPMTIFVSKDNVNIQRKMEESIMERSKLVNSELYDAPDAKKV